MILRKPVRNVDANEAARFLQAFLSFWVYVRRKRIYVRKKKEKNVP